MFDSMAWYWDPSPMRYRPIRTDHSGHDTTTRYEHDTNMNLIRYEKIIKTRQKIRYDMDKKMNTTRRHEYLKIA